MNADLFPNWNNSCNCMLKLDDTFSFLYAFSFNRGESMTNVELFIRVLLFFGAWYCFFSLFFLFFAFFFGNCSIYSNAFHRGCTKIPRFCVTIGFDAQSCHLHRSWRIWLLLPSHVFKNYNILDIEILRSLFIPDSYWLVNRNMLNDYQLIFKYIPANLIGIK